MIERITSSQAVRYAVSMLMLAAILIGAYCEIIDAKREHAEAVELRRQWEHASGQ